MQRNVSGRSSQAMHLGIQKTLLSTLPTGIEQIRIVFNFQGSYTDLIIYFCNIENLINF